MIEEDTAALGFDCTQQGMILDLYFLFLYNHDIPFHFFYELMSFQATTWPWRHHFFQLFFFLFHYH